MAAELLVQLSSAVSPGACIFPERGSGVCRSFYLSSCCCPVDSRCSTAPAAFRTDQGRFEGHSPFGAAFGIRHIRRSDSPDVSCLALHGVVLVRVIAIQPIAINYKERGRNYHLDGRYREAVADFTAAIERIPETLRPYSYNFYAFRAESLRCAGVYAEAIRDFDTAISMLPHPVYFHHRGLALKALGRAAEAESDFIRGG